MKLIIAEKPSVAKSIASALGASSRAEAFYAGSGLLVSWCVWHLVSPMDVLQEKVCTFEKNLNTYSRGSFGFSSKDSKINA